MNIEFILIAFGILSTLAAIASFALDAFNKKSRVGSIFAIAFLCLATFLGGAGITILALPPSVEPVASATEPLSTIEAAQSSTPLAPVPVSTATATSILTPTPRVLVEATQTAEAVLFEATSDAITSRAAISQRHPNCPCCADSCSYFYPNARTSFTNIPANSIRKRRR